MLNWIFRIFRASGKKGADGSDKGSTDPITPTPEAEIVEPICAVLRRQMPVKSGEQRSWLGGLPKMPEDIPWPECTPEDRTSPIALNFLAQISCADLPADLWGGHGPREGWLCVFLCGADEFTEMGGSQLQVIHITELGPTRQPPDNLGPVANVYLEKTYCPQEDVPKEWIQWPVDILKIPNDGSGVDAARLYGEETNDVPLRNSWPELGWDPAGWPKTWRGAQYLVYSLLETYRDPPRPVTSFDLAQREKFKEPEALSKIRAEEAKARSNQATAIAEYRKDLKIAEYRENLEKETDHDKVAQETDPDEIAHEIAHLKDRIAFVSQARETALHLSAERDAIIEAGGVDEKIQEVDRSAQAYSAWCQTQGNMLEHLYAKIRAFDPAAPMPESEFREVLKAITAPRHQWTKVGRHLVFETVDAVLFDPEHMSGEGYGVVKRVLSEEAVEAYVSGEELSEETLATYMPNWCGVSRPHQLGGKANFVQDEGDFPGHLLLFQIGGDAGMSWDWGDDGALYIFIRPEDLNALNFRNVSWWLSTH